MKVNKIFNKYIFFSIILITLGYLIHHTICCKQANILASNKDVVKRAHSDVWSNGDLDSINEIYSEDFVAHWVVGLDSDLNEFTEKIKRTRDAFPDLREEIIHIIAEDDLVVTYFMSSGTLLGELDGIMPTGNKGKNPEIAIHKIKDGKIIEQWVISDRLNLLQKLGIKF